MQGGSQEGWLSDHFAHVSCSPFRFDSLLVFVLQVGWCLAGWVQGWGGGGCVAVESGFGWLVMRRWSVIVMLRKGLLGGLACQRVQGLVFVCIRGLRVALCGALRLIVW